MNSISMQEEPELVKQKLGYLPEILPLYAEMTVEEYLMFCAELKRITKDHRESEVYDVLTAYN